MTTWWLLVRVTTEEGDLSGLLDGGRLHRVSSHTSRSTRIHSILGDLFAKHPVIELRKNSSNWLIWKLEIVSFDRKFGSQILMASSDGELWS